MLSAHLTDVLLRTLGARPFRRAVTLPSGVVKVNVGSGLAVVPGWINLDASLNALAAHLPTPLQRVAYTASGSRLQHSRDEYLGILKNHCFVFCDVRRGLPLPDESVDYLYASHLLEHLERAEAVALVTDARRVMKEGATFRIVVPDLAHYMALYAEGAGEEVVAGIFSSGVPGRLGRHRYMYDEAGLRRLAGEAGFEEVMRCAFRQGAMVDADLLDNREDESVYLEVTKTGRGGRAR